MRCYKVADVVFGVSFMDIRTAELMKEYLADEGEKSEFVIEVNQQDIDYEKSLVDEDFSLPIIEFTAIYRKYINVMLDSYDGFFFHCSAVAMDNEAYMFSAASGTGKSTHRRLWQKVYGDRVQIINDDKPMIRKVDGVFYVYGTPWQGKENLGANIRVPAKALCFLSRAEQNSIEKLSSSNVVGKMLCQTVRPKKPQRMLKLLGLIDGFLSQSGVYSLKVNMNDDAPIVAYNGINNK